MKEQEHCHICGKKIKAAGATCKVCKADPSERFIVECRAIRYANAVIVSNYLNLVLTDRRLLAFEDMKAALSAGITAGAIGGGSSGLGSLAEKLMGGSPTERVVKKTSNGSLKFDAPLASIVSIERESDDADAHIYITASGQKKPLRIVLGTSSDGTLMGDDFLDMLLSAMGR